MAVSLLPVFLKKPKKPFFSSSSRSKPFSSTTSWEIWSPTSPKSLVRTLFKVVSEKEAIFFWAAEPYCSTNVELVKSIFSAKSSTTLRSSGESTLSSKVEISSSCTCLGAGAASSGVKVRDGVSTPSKVREGVWGTGASMVNLISSGMLLTSLVFLAVWGCRLGRARAPPAGSLAFSFDSAARCL